MLFEIFELLSFSEEPSYSVEENLFRLRKEKVFCLNSSVTFHYSHFYSLSVA